MVGQNLAAIVDLQLVAKQRRKPQLPHERQGKLIKRIGEDHHLAPLSEPGQKILRAVQRPHAGDHLLNVCDRELVVCENGQPALHQRVVIRHFPRRDFQFFDAGLDRNIDPNLRHQDAFQVKTREHRFPHRHPPSKAIGS